MFLNLLLVGLGGAAGSILRYLCQRSLNVGFPFGTLMVNILGCFLIGLLWGLSFRGMDEPKKLLWITGFCGGFTTFSAFTQEGLVLMEAQRWVLFLIYISASVVCGLVATYAGYKLSS